MRSELCSLIYLAKSATSPFQPSYSIVKIVSFEV